MDADILPDTLAEVRQVIDELDSQLIGFLAAAGLSPDVAEAVWQAMIAAFIRFEQEVNRSGGTAN